MIRTGETVAKEFVRRPNAVRARRWHAVEEPHAEVFALVRKLENEQSSRRDELVELRYLHEHGGARTGRDYRVGRAGVSANVTKSVVSAVCARISKSKPRPMFLTDGGNWRQKRRARKLTTYVAGVFHHAGTYKAMQHAFKDACVGHFGAVRFFAEDAQIKSERVMPEELFVDEREARYGAPRSLHQRRIVDRDVLIAMFPDHEAAIENTNAASPRTFTASRLTSVFPTDLDAVEVIESWRLPTSAESDDGVHSICVDGTTLLREPYEHERFPFVVMYWEAPDEGFFGTGLAAEIKGIQYEIARLLKTIQTAQIRMAGGRIFVPRGAKVDAAQFTNEPGVLIPYDGQRPPSTDTSPTVSPELYQHLAQLKRDAYEIPGISQLSAKSEKPAGLNSGVALRTMQDVESERFVLKGQMYENAFLEAAKIVVMLSRDLYADNDVVVRAPGRKFVESIKWSDVSLEDDQYVLQVFPTSQLPQTPEGRMQFVSEMESKGYLSREQALMLFDYPDIERFTSTLTAPSEAVEALLDKMLDTGAPVVPEPFMNLQLCLSTAQGLFSQAQANDDMDEEQLDLLRNFMTQTEELLNVGNSNAGPVDPGPQPPAVDAGGPAGPAGPPGIPGAGLPQGLAA